MVTLYNAENALKTIYLGVMTEYLNTKTNPLLTKISQTTSDVWGKDIRTNAGFGDDTYLLLCSRLKNLYAQVKIPEQAIRAANDYTSLTTWVDILNSSLEESLDVAKKELGKMLYGDNDGEPQPHCLTSISEILNISKPLYDQQRETSPILKPYISTANKLDDSVIERALEELSNRGANIDYIAVSFDVKNAYVKLHKNIDIVELDGGFKALSYQGIPLVCDRFVPKDTMYLLDTSVFKLHQLCDWRWLETENGKILKQSDNGKDYTATLVKYCDLICHRPDRQGKITFTETN